VPWLHGSSSARQGARLHALHLHALPIRRAAQVHLALPREDQAALVKEARALDAARAALEAGAALGGLPAEQRQLVTAFYRRCAELKARLTAPAARRAASVVS